MGKKSAIPPPIILNKKGGPQDPRQHPTDAGEVIGARDAVITIKWYQCECGQKFRTSTNHWGTIYRGCRIAGYPLGAGHSTAECIHAAETLLELARQGGEGS